MSDDHDFNALTMAMAAQADAFEKRERSSVEKRYGLMTEKSTAALKKFMRNASFDQLLSIEQSFQKNDLGVYAKAPSTLKSVREGMADFENGEEVYRQLLNDPEAYKDHKYREKERASPDRLVPLDAMRRALRGQAARVENYRKNVMNNPQEHAFMSARAAMIRRAEKLYDGIQRDRLLPPPTPHPSTARPARPGGCR